MSYKKESIKEKEISFSENGTIPVIAQDYESGEVLLLSTMNEEAWARTLETGYVHYYNTETKGVEKFGEIRKNTQKLKAAFLDYQGKTLLLKVKQSVGALPVSFTYYNNQIVGNYNDIGGEMFGRLQRIVKEYKTNPEDGAYTSFLFAKGVDRISKKVGEEAVELVIASKNEAKENVIHEAADLLYHTTVLLTARDVKISEVCAELCKRNR